MALPAPASMPLWQRRGLRGNAPLALTITSESDAKQKQEVVRSRERLATEFEIVGKVGEGTTASVQHAIRKSDGRHVALKSMRADDPEMLAFAKAEFDMLRTLEHPNIVRALDFIEAPDQATVVLDLFDGMDLVETVEQMPEGRLSEEVAMPLISQLADATMYLHSRKIVHRDIKPQNVLVSRDLKRVMLVDFNIAHNLEGGLALTPTGTRLYAAPEVLLGRESPSEAADIWAVGLCAHLLLSGKLPQGRSMCETCMDLLHECAKREVHLLGLRWAKVSEQCKTMLHKCFAAEPSERLLPTAALSFSNFSMCLSSPSKADTPMFPNVIPELQTFSLNGQSVIVKNTFVDVAEAEQASPSHRRRSKSAPATWRRAKALEEDLEQLSSSDEPLHEVRRRVFTICCDSRSDVFGDMERASTECNSKSITADESPAPSGLTKEWAQANNLDATEVMSNASTQLPCSSVGDLTEAAATQTISARVPISLDSFLNGGLVAVPAAPPLQDTGNRTTLMFRNLPQQFCRSKLEKLLKAEGFGMLYDFIYLPADLGTGSCFGYAFINMVTPRDAERFLEHFQGFDRWPEGDARRAVVHLSEALQGLEEQIERYRNSPLMHPRVSDELRPAVYSRGVRRPFPKPTVSIRPPRIRTSTKRKVLPRSAARSDL